MKQISFFRHKLNYVWNISGKSAADAITKCNRTKKKEKEKIEIYRKREYNIFITYKISRANERDRKEAAINLTAHIYQFYCANELRMQKTFHTCWKWKVHDIIMINTSSASSITLSIDFFLYFYRWLLCWYNRNVRSIYYVCMSNHYLSFVVIKVYIYIACCVKLSLHFSSLTSFSPFRYTAVNKWKWTRNVWGFNFSSSFQKKKLIIERIWEIGSNLNKSVKKNKTQLFAILLLV